MHRRLIDDVVPCQRISVKKRDFVSLSACYKPGLVLIARTKCPALTLQQWRASADEHPAETQ